MAKRTRTHQTARDYPRTARLNRLFQQILAEELEHIDDERLELVTIMSVDCEGDLRHATVPDFDRNNALEFGPRASLRRKFGLGPFAPSVSADLGLRYRDTGLAGDRGWLASGGVRAAKRLTGTLRTAVTGDWLEQYAAHSTFDIRQRSLRAELAWDFSERWSLTVNRGRMWGDVVANAACLGAALRALRDESVAASRSG